MAIVRYVPPQGGYKPSTEELARIDALTDEEITRAAEGDPDNPPLTDDEFARIDTVKAVRAGREATGLSQEAFAKAYCLSLGRVRDLEQGRTTADTPLLYFLRQIAKDPEGVRAELASRAA